MSQLVRFESSEDVVRVLAGGRIVLDGGTLEDAAGTTFLLRKATVHLTTAQILALFTTPVQVVAAPGVGKWVNPHFAVASYKFGTRPFGYVVGPPNLVVSLQNILGSPYMAALFPTDGSLFSQMADAIARTDSFVVYPSDTSVPISHLENLPLQLFSSSNLSGGPIATSSLSFGGSGYAIGDTGTINGGSGQSSDAAYVVDSVQAYVPRAIIGIIQGDGSHHSTFVVAGSHASEFQFSNTLGLVTVGGSTGNNGSYQITDSTFDGTNTLIPVGPVGALPSAVANGTIVATAPIVAVDQGAKKFTMPNFVIGQPSPDGSQFQVSGSTGNDGVYTIANSGNSYLVTVEPIPSVVADGVIRPFLNPVATYHLTSPGTNYRPASGDATATGGGQPGSGTGFTVNVLTVLQGDGTARVDVYYTIESVA